MSSIYAIKNTLEKRWLALQGLAEELSRNPNLWKQRQRLDELDVDDIDAYDELNDEERDALDGIMADPKKLKLFTTSKSIGEIQMEASEVKKLYMLAKELYENNQEEKKYQELKSLLMSQGVIDGEKLVIFTEHKDIL